MKNIFFLIIPFFLFSSTIKEIEFQNLYQISPSSAKEIIGISVLDTLDYSKINESIKVLYQNKFFNNIEVFFQDGVLKYVFEEKPVIAKIDIKGMFKDKQSEILEALSLKKGNLYDKEKVKVAESKLSNLLESMGEYDSIITTTVEEFKKGSLRVNMHINKGEDIRIKKINFKGLDKIKYSDFESELQNNEQDFMGWLWGRNDGKLKLHALEVDSHKIKDYYMSKGYLDAYVSPAFLKVHFDGYYASLDYTIEEGKKYLLDNIDIVSKNPNLDINALKSELMLHKNDVFNIKKIRKELNKITTYLHNLGYAKAIVNPNLRKDDIFKKVSLNIELITNQKFYVRDVKISGNTNTIDRVIRREIYLAPGDLFIQSDIQDSINALNRTGYFSNVDIQSIPITNNSVDLLVKVKEGPTGSIAGGIGYSSGDGFLLNVKYSERNIFGSGIEVGVNYDRSSSTSSGKLYFHNPRIFDSIYSLGGSVFKNNYESTDFDKDSKGFDLVIGKKLTRHISASLRILNENNDVSQYPSSLDYLYTQPKTLKQSISPTITYNSTDDFYIPRSGISASVGAEYAGFSGNEKFSKVYTKFATFYSPEYFQDRDIDLILRYKVKVALLKDNGYIPISSKYFLGGLRSLRGYDYATLSPRDNTSESNRIGGDRYYHQTIEASIPLIKDAKMRIFAFVDSGAIGAGNFDIQRNSTGLGIEWFSPMGPLQFIFSKPLNAKDIDETSRFDFSMGTSF